mmetsp:Transcript_22473/g.51798  ORF Transcript_22473/g.51798 Transcript_22473/m.51798 type:complete len:308 (-) Transcript_22473:1009-1932(-)|eukprot:CAMPEP_0116834088 /NCGR_PEP_ID=MMETSP0418-20121206/6797_1 /TAXON_ID=1158023 /ORGANISM="Astrosyne radiata, Strain 13vi08-1A" /LENGTH=307 /DNA_ID=CAMNT_0004463609 /DNA_START=319 /DNA_END=1242 /DNA_ORIENTATION=-
MSKVQGTVKWFSNKKGYGFIEPTSENSPTKEDIFVHQSSVASEGYRTLSEGWVVEFDVVNDTDGKIKADNVTAPGGGPCTGPRRPRRKRNNKPNDTEGGDDDEEQPAAQEKDQDPEVTGEGNNPQETEKNGSDNANNNKTTNGKDNNRNNNGRKKPLYQQWHRDLAADVLEALDKKSIRHTTGTVDVSLDKARIKLGTRGYVSMAHADGILAEGTFTSDEKGVVTFTWVRALVFEEGAWKSRPTEGLMSTLTLTDDTVKAVGDEETPESLWGEGKADPKKALEDNEFQMRRVVLTPKAKGNKKPQEE